jgi:purine-cytosine permease-like protein
MCAELPIFVNPGVIMKTVRIGKFRLRLPNHPIARVVLGVLLILLGFLGFLPVLGFWMIPLGLIVLSVDFSWVRRRRRLFSVRLGVWLDRRWPRLARALGFGPVREDKS